LDAIVAAGACPAGWAPATLRLEVCIRSRQRPSLERTALESGLGCVRLTPDFMGADALASRSRRRAGEAGGLLP
jgi:hypothetical protein